MSYLCTCSRKLTRFPQSTMLHIILLEANATEGAQRAAENNPMLLLTGCDEMHLRDWWSCQALYYLLPNKVYFFLGADEVDSKGECEWYISLELLVPAYMSTIDYDDDAAKMISEPHATEHNSK